MVKIKSKQASSKTVVNAKDADNIAKELADKPYGSSIVEETERLTISLPLSLYDEVEALAKKRKRAKEENRSMAAITRQALKDYLGKYND